MATSGANWERKLTKAIRGARRDYRSGDDGERRCRFRECLGIGPDLQDGLREQGHEAVRAAFGGGLEFYDVSVVVACDDQIHFLVGKLRPLFHTPAVLAKKTGE
jgi:hypothetical protein